jgi:hypothetical protein
LFAEHFRGASEDLQRPDQIEDLRSRRGHEDDPTRARLDRLLIIKCRSRTGISSALGHNFLSAVANLSGAASKVFLSSSEQK